MIAFLADQHFGCRSFNKTIFETQMDYYEKEFFPYILNHNIKKVISLGDIVHNRNIIDLWILQELKQRFFQWFDDNDVELHILVGNHDSYFKSTIETNFFAENINEFKNTITYDKPTIIKIGKYTIGMMPWIVDEKEVELLHGVDILCGHFDIKGIQTMKNIYSSEGFDLTKFKEYKYVFSGHYHIKSQTKNVYYVGTQYQLSWSDYGEEKGFYVLDEKYKLKYINNETTPKFIKMYYTDDKNVNQIKIVGLGDKVVDVTKEEAIEYASNNYVKLITDKINDSSTLDNFYTSLTNISKNNYKIEMINSNEIVETFDFDEIESDVSNDANTYNLIKDCLQSITFEKNIVKPEMLSIFDELYNEALEYQKFD